MSAQAQPRVCKAFACSNFSIYSLTTPTPSAKCLRGTRSVTTPPSRHGCNHWRAGAANGRGGGGGNDGTRHRGRINLWGGPNERPTLKKT